MLRRLLRLPGRSRVLRCLAVAATLGLAVPAVAQETSAIPDPREASRAEFQQVSRDLVLSDEKVAKLAADIATLRKDYATITAALIQSAKTEKKLNEDIEVIGERLARQKDQEQAIRKSLWARRDVLAEVLGGLERMGLNPPPAILVTPQDALSSVRSAILLGAVVPGLRQETDALLADLNELSRLSASIQAERDRLSAAATDLMAEKKKLAFLLNEKERLRGENEAELEAERNRAAQLARKSKNLKELIASLEVEADKRREAEEAERQADAERARREDQLAAMPVPEHNRLVGAIAFDALRGQLSLPVSGRRAKRFGDKDGLGGTMHGDMVATQSAAIVTAPVDASVLYAGPFRSYGQLLILNAGDGYHVVLAGLGRITVTQGQAVLAGEPVGAMGEARVASAASRDVGSGGSELYVEFRKDGKPVDPDRWWMD
jgi:septal ring factor EnvC (AmiA/AmiB activator)